MPITNRSYTPRTSRLMSEYAAKEWPGLTVRLDMPLIRPNPEAIARAGGNVSPAFGGTTMGYVDAVVAKPGDVQLWEAANSLSGAKIGQLQTYGQLWPLSVQSQDYPDTPISLHMLVARADTAMLEVAHRAGIDVVVYNPDWYAASQKQAEAVGAQRKMEALAAGVLTHFEQGLIPRDEAINQLIELGFDHNAAVDKVVAAIDAMSTANG